MLKQKNTNRERKTARSVQNTPANGEIDRPDLSLPQSSGGKRAREIGNGNNEENWSEKQKAKALGTKPEQSNISRANL